MIIIPNITGQKFAVLGLGKSGLATAASLKASGADVVVWDDNPEAQQAATKAGYAVQDLSAVDPKAYQALVMSPGIPHTFPVPHPAAEKFRKAAVPIIGDVELLFRAQPDATFVGITGTNGKSTTTALIGHILQRAGRKIEVGGNLGTPVLSFAPLGKGGIYVLELSSYQLELIHSNPLAVSVLLNITPDHLGRHGGMVGYIAAKARIFNLGKSPQTLIIGSGEEEMHVLHAAAIEHPHRTVTKIEASGLEKLVDPTALPTLPGPHNWQNASAAFLACRALGVVAEDIIVGLKTFPGLAHRQQAVATVKGVLFVNDSKATNADAASKALACYDDVYWIIGGRAKEDGLNGLEKFATRIRHAYIIGEASERFAVWCRDRVPYTICGALDVATRQAADQAMRDEIKGAVVLLSPACASWDQFKSFEDRGEQFIALVNQLAVSVPKVRP
jgi:UDP-N-acetylmuramoylalanine--D-glutamate ligase